MTDPKEKNIEKHNEKEEVFELSEEDLERMSGGRVNFDHLLQDINEIKKIKKTLKKFKPKDGNKH